MSDPFDAAYYERICGRARRILVAVSDGFSEKEVAVVEMLIDANEPGVALEMLLEMLLEASVSVEGAVAEMIEGLARDMNLSAETVERAKKINLAR